MGKNYARYMTDGYILQRILYYTLETYNKRSNEGTWTERKTKENHA